MGLEEWTSRNIDELRRIQCEVRILETHGNEVSVSVNVGGLKLMVIMPAALVLGLEVTEEMESVLSDLNENLQDMSPPPTLDAVLDTLLAKLVAPQRKKHKIDEDGQREVVDVDEESDGEDDVDDDDDDKVAGLGMDELGYDCFLSKEPESLYGLAIAAGKSRIKNCVITVAIGVKISLKLSFHKKWIARSLGLFPDEPLDITLRFDDAWGVHRLARKDFYPCSLDVSQRRSKEEKSLYVLTTMLPNLAMVFCEYYARKTKGDWINYIMAGQLEKAARVGNPLIGLVKFMTARLESLCETCPICYRLLPAATLKVQACSNDLCQFKCQEMGLGTSLLELIHSSPEVVELEVALMMFAASSSGRDVLEPFPSFMLKDRELRESNGWFGTKNATINVQNKMTSMVSSVLSSIPTVEVLSRCNTDTELEELLKKSVPHSLKVALSKGNTARAVLQPETLPLKMLRFCLSSNRMSLRYLDKEERLPIDCLAQFAVLYDAPEREAFLAAEGCKSSSFAFHGSSDINWYSILRNGVRSMSNTAYMSAGAASGAGIYAATALATSLPYSQYPRSGSVAGYGRFVPGTSCVAIIEVLASVTCLQHGVYVIPKDKEERTVVRYLLVWEPNNASGGAKGHNIHDKHWLDNKLNLFDHHRQLQLYHSLPLSQ